MQQVAKIIAAAFALSLLLSPSPAAAEERKVPQTRDEMLLSFSPVVRQVAPAVVNIYARRMVERRPVSPLFDDPFFKRFFGDAFGDLGRPQRREQQSLGSGVLVGAEGYVVTNHHVIAGADEIRVVLNDRREFDAELILDDERTDLAVLRIERAPEDLPYLAFRDSDDLEVGDLVLAIGNPFGVGQTVTSGIVSGLARTQVGISDYSFFIQTDAAINPGNSGGALVTLDGRLVGINTAIFSRSGGSVGIGFAIPSNMVASVVESAVTGGKLLRAWAGVTGEDVTPELAEALRLPTPSGVVVNRLHPKGPAAEAGLAVGDVIRAIDGKPVEGVQSLRYRIATRRLGGRAELEIWRKGKTLGVHMPLVAAPEVPPRNDSLLEGRQPLAGAKVANLSPALSEELEIPGAWEGVVVIAVARGSSAARFGFRPGDILVSINGKRVASVAELKRALAKSENRWSIAVEREGKVMTLQVAG